MKITELLLHEVMETGFPIEKISPTTWEVIIPQDSINTNSEYKNNGVSIRVDIVNQKVDNYTIIEVSFGVPGSAGVKLEKIFDKTEVFKLLKSIIDIIKTYDSDIVLIVPNDISVDIDNKKASLYRTVAYRMKKLGIVGRIEEFNDSGHAFLAIFPTASKAWKLDNSEIQNLLIQFGGNKV